MRRPIASRTSLLVVQLLLFVHAPIEAQASDPLLVQEIPNLTASAVAWSPDGRYLAAGDSTGVLVYTPDLRLLYQLAGPVGQMTSLQWSPDGALLAASSKNEIGLRDPDEELQKSVLIWNTESWDLHTRYDEHQAPVSGVAWSPDGSLIASGSWDGTIRVWVPGTGQTLYVLFAPDSNRDAIFSMDWSITGTMAANNNDQLYVWESFASIPEELASEAGAISWSPAGDRITLGSGYVTLGDKVVHEMVNCSQSGFTEWSPDGRWYATYTWHDGIQICNPETDQVVLHFIAALNTDGTFGYQDMLSWSPDGTKLASAGGDGFVRIWDVSSLMQEP